MPVSIKNNKKSPEEIQRIEQEKKNFGKRIKQFLEYKNISQSKFSDIVGTERSNITHIIQGRHFPSMEIIQPLIKNFPELNINWLITGEGEMLNNFTKNIKASDDVETITNEQLSSDRSSVKINKQINNDKSKPTERDLFSKQNLENKSTLSTPQNTNQTFQSPRQNEQHDYYNIPPQQTQQSQNQPNYNGSPPNNQPYNFDNRQPFYQQQPSNNPISNYQYNNQAANNNFINQQYAQAFFPPQQTAQQQFTNFQQMPTANQFFTNQQPQQNTENFRNQFTPFSNSQTSFENTNQSMFTNQQQLNFSGLQNHNIVFLNNRNMQTSPAEADKILILFPDNTFAVYEKR